jgi:hypothetical protein
MTKREYYELKLNELEMEITHYQNLEKSYWYEKIDNPSAVHSLALYWLYKNHVILLENTRNTIKSILDCWDAPEDD